RHLPCRPIGEVAVREVQGPQAGEVRRCITVRAPRTPSWLRFCPASWQLRGVTGVEQWVILPDRPVPPYGRPVNLAGRLRFKKGPGRPGFLRGGPPCAFCSSTRPTRR